MNKSQSIYGVMYFNKGKWRGPYMGELHPKKHIKDAKEHVRQAMKAPVRVVRSTFTEVSV